MSLVRTLPTRVFSSSHWYNNEYVSHRGSVTESGIDRFLTDYSKLADTDDSLNSKLTYVNLIIVI